MKEMAKKGIFKNDIDRVANRYILSILRDLKGWIGDETRACITCFWSFRREG